MGQSSSQILNDQYIVLTMTSKSLSRQATKYTKDEKIQESRLKKAIEVGDKACAEVYASNVIRLKHQRISTLRLESRISAITQRVKTAIFTEGLTESMGTIVKGMDLSMSAMSVEGISKVMDKFEEQFENLDVVSSYMDSAIDTSTSAATPEDEVSTLIKLVADEHGLQIASDLDDAGVVSKCDIIEEPTTPPEEPVTAEISDLMARFNALSK